MTESGARRTSVKIHVISTANGLTNEGMRNVATHLSREFEKNHIVRHSGLKDIAAILRNSLRSDVTFLFARANARVYRLAQMARMLCGRVWIVCVQKPDDAFIRRCAKRALKCGYLALAESDLDGLAVGKGYCVKKFSAGIDAAKFAPVARARARELKMQYGFPPDKLLVVHVGHCSSGRGLEDFAALNSPGIERFVVASGMFEHGETVRTLRESGVKVVSGYIPNVEEVYQMADVYLFPTRSADHVISIPLSVMEALACGTPVVAYRGFDNLRRIPVVNPSAITYVGDKSELTAAVWKASGMKADQSHLSEVLSWSECAGAMIRFTEGGRG
jgi:glycosyltransferase involved in cell wall biosynthesis